MLLLLHACTTVIIQHSDTVIMNVYPGLLESGKTTVFVQDIADEVNVDATNTEGWQIIFDQMPAQVRTMVSAWSALWHTYFNVSTDPKKRYSSSRSS